MTAGPTSVPLAVLREDLILSQGNGPGSIGAEWRIYDPLRHCYIAIDQSTGIVLSLWSQSCDAAELAALAAARLARPVPVTEIEELSSFLRQHGLTHPSPDMDWRRCLTPQGGSGQGMMMRLVHSYLFFKFPLFEPEKFLRATWPMVRPLFSRPAAIVIALIGLLGLYFVSRQWSLFLDDARSLMTAAGIAQFGATLFVVKIFHEFGHAFTAHRFRCRVPVMGVAVMMGAPVLYTDVTDAWRLTDKRQRLLIDGAGVLVELGIACLATFAWVFLPEGAPRQIAFLLATSSWLMSLVINLNPFLRFDGYYILADVAGIENLQARAFEFGIWRLREVLFGLGNAAPENLPTRMTWFLVCYAWCVWVFRLTMFVGIALAVYAFFFKALGVAMFVFEIGYFIAKPVWSEIRVWLGSRSSIFKTSRAWVSATIAGLMLVAFVAPWSTHVAVPAVIESRGIAALHVARPSRVVRLVAVPLQQVSQGDIIAEFNAPELDHDVRVVQARLQALQVRISRILSDREDRDEHIVLETMRASLAARLAGLVKEQRELVVRAPVDGVLVDLNAHLYPGRWVNTNELIAQVRSATGVSIRGFVAESQAWRVRPGQSARFVPDASGLSTLSVSVTTVSPVAAGVIDAQELIQAHGGPIDSNPDERRRAKPTIAQFVVTAAPLSEAHTATSRSRGTLHVTAESESFAIATFKRVLRVLVRESGI